MTITEDDLTLALRQLHAENHPNRQDGEFTIAEYVAANNITVDAAENTLEYLLKIGKIERPPKRFIGGRIVRVYKIVARAPWTCPPQPVTE